MENPQAIDPKEVTRPDIGCGVISAGIFCGSVFIYPMLICGCHFHLSAAIATFVPLAWSVWLLASYQTAMGRFGSWLSFLVACAWLWIGYDSNLKFIL